MFETENYRDNFSTFLNQIQDSFVEKVTFKVEAEPTFDKGALPFNFTYCFCVKFITDKGNYSLRTAMTNSGVDTFWVEPAEVIESSELIKPVYSKVNAISYEKGYDDIAYKIAIELGNYEFIIYAAEIYDTANGSYEYKVNDEMILVFEDKEEAGKFESAVNMPNTNVH